MNEKERKRCLERMIFRWIKSARRKIIITSFSRCARDVVLYKREVYKTHKPTGKKNRGAYQCTSEFSLL